MVEPQLNAVIQAQVLSPLLALGNGILSICLWLYSKDVHAHGCFIPPGSSLAGQIGQVKADFKEIILADTTCQSVMYPLVDASEGKKKIFLHLVG